MQLYGKIPHFPVFVCAVHLVEDILAELEQSVIGENEARNLRREEFKDLQLSYFKASVIDIEVPTDQLIFAILYRLAKENNIEYILDGYNFRTEFGMPKDWSAEKKFDLTNLKNIHAKFGKVKLKPDQTIVYCPQSALTSIQACFT